MTATQSLKTRTSSSDPATTRIGVPHRRTAAILLCVTGVVILARLAFAFAAADHVSALSAVAGAGVHVGIAGAVIGAAVRLHRTGRAETAQVVVTSLLAAFAALAAYVTVRAPVFEPRTHLPLWGVVAWLATVCLLLRRSSRA